MAWRRGLLRLWCVGALLWCVFVAAAGWRTLWVVLSPPAAACRKETFAGTGGNAEDARTAVVGGDHDQIPRVSRLGSGRQAFNLYLGRLTIAIRPPDLSAT